MTLVELLLHFFIVKPALDRMADISFLRVMAFSGVAAPAKKSST